MIMRDTGRPRKDAVGCDNRYDNANGYGPYGTDPPLMKQS